MTGARPGDVPSPRPDRSAPPTAGEVLSGGCRRRRRADNLSVAADRVRMGAVEHRIDDPSDADQVYAAYLAVLYVVRGARPGEQLSLRSEDLDVLLAAVGDDPETIEKRLVALMGCTAEEATLLRGVLLRRKALVTATGVVAAVSLASAVSVGTAAELFGDRGAPDRTVQLADGPSGSSAPGALRPGSAAPERGPSAGVAPTSPTSTTAGPGPSVSVVPVVPSVPAAQVAPAAPRPAADRPSASRPAPRPAVVAPAPGETAAPDAPQLGVPVSIPSPVEGEDGVGLIPPLVLEVDPSVPPPPSRPLRDPRGPWGSPTGPQPIDDEPVVHVPVAPVPDVPTPVISVPVAQPVEDAPVVPVPVVEVPVEAPAVQVPAVEAEKTPATEVPQPDAVQDDDGKGRQGRGSRGKGPSGERAGNGHGGSSRADGDNGDRGSSGT